MTKIILKCTALLVSLVTVWLVSVQGVQAATFTVTTTDDHIDVAGCTTSDCSLREAVRAANANSEADTITLGQGTYTLSIAGVNESVALTGDLDLTSQVIINGVSAATTIIDGGDIDRVFDIDMASSVQLNKMTIQNGFLSDGHGAGVYTSSSTVVMSDVVVRNNQGTNSATSGVHVTSGTVTIQRSAIIDNIAASSSTVSNHGTLNLKSVTMSGNTGAPASAIYSNGITNITHSTIVNNTNSTAIFNVVTTGSVVNVKNSILSNEVNCNTSLTSFGYNIETGSTCSFAATGDQTNISTDALKLEALDDNGGNTYTHALLFGSAAINAASCRDIDNSTMTVDQRNVTRPQSGSCDVGAYEFKDVDNDRSPSELDCNDSDATVSVVQTFYQDADGDGLGNAQISSVVCAASVTGYVTNDDDANDNDADNDGVESTSDCNDQNASITNSPVTYYQDADSDGLGNPQVSTVACTPPSGYVTNNSDTDDAAPVTTSPVVVDQDGDGVSAEQDCNDADRNISTVRTYYEDKDTDTKGNVNSTQVVCSTTPPSGYVTNATDCNDEDAAVMTVQTYYRDADSDGLGNAAVSVSVCAAVAPSGYVTNANDTDDTVSNNVTETPSDGTDNDGDDTVDEPNTPEDNGTAPSVGTTDPTDPDAFTTTISSFEGKKNGKIKVTFTDGLTYVYTIYDLDTDSKTIVKQYQSSGYLLVLHPKGKKLALVNPYTGAIAVMVSLSSDQGYKSSGLKQANVRSDQDSQIEVVVTSKKDNLVQVSVVKVNVTKPAIKLYDKLKGEFAKVDSKNTKVASKSFTLRTEEDKTVAKLKVSKDYQLTIE